MEKTFFNKHNRYCSFILRAGSLLVLSIILMSTGAFAQKDGIYTVIEGRVVDAFAKQGFAGAKIEVVNLKISAMTGDDGTFEIKVPRMDVTLSVNAPGYQNQEVPLKGRSKVEIQLLKESVIPSFYDESKFTATGTYQTSIANFTSNVPVINENIVSGMSGQLRGVVHSGTQGSGSALFVRGFNSLNSSSQPLYVVDGVVWRQQEGIESIHSGFFVNPLALIDPNDVETITVLKGGTSIYGSKGANGVVIINTKRARSQATEISANISMGYRSPFSTMPVMDADAYRLYASDIIKGAYSAADIDKLHFLDDNPKKPYYQDVHNNTNWLDEINRGASMQSYGIDVKGGDDIALYAFSLGYNKTDCNIKETSFDRMNVRFNSDINLSKRLKLAFDFALTRSNNYLRDDGIDSISSPYYLAMIKSPLYSPYYYNIDRKTLSNKVSDVDELNVGNPLAIINKGLGQSTQYGLNTSILPSYMLVDDKLKLSFLFAHGWKKLDENAFVPDFGIVTYPLINEQGDVYAYAQNFVRNRMDRHYSSIILDGRIDWNAWKDELNFLKVYGGWRYYTDSYSSRYVMGYNTGSDNVSQIANTPKYLRNFSGRDDNWQSISWYLNGDYSLCNRYLISLVGALDASSRFGKKAGSLHLGGVAWAPFGSATLGWVASSEKFMKNVDFINFLKLSAGYSTSGSDNLPNYAARTYFKSAKYTSSYMGLALSNIGNEHLKWQTTSTGQVGLDLSMLNNRWSISAEMYTSETRDLLTRKPLNEISGLEYYWNNDGKLENKGYEVSTNIRFLNLRDLKMDIGATIGHYKNRITSLNSGTFVTEICGAEILSEINRPAGVFYGYKTKGVFATKEDAAAANLCIVDNTGKKTLFDAGDIYFEDLNYDGIINEKDKQIIGDPNPDFYGNFNLNVTYKGFSLGALFTYSYGNDVYNALRANLESGSQIYNQSTTMQNRWVANGQQTSVPRATYGDPMGNARFSDRWIEDGSFLKFKTLSLSYDVPFNLTFLQGITVWGAVNNIYTFTKYLGADPECAYGNTVLYQGIDAGLVPQTRSYNLGVKIKL